MQAWLDRLAEPQNIRRLAITFSALVVAAVVMGAGSLVLVIRQADATTGALREECERVNVLRVNQGRGFRDQIRQTQRALAGDLGVLEPFRPQVEAGLALREYSLRRLRVSVRDHRLGGRAALKYREEDRPYRVDCVEAYP